MTTESNGPSAEADPNPIDEKLLRALGAKTFVLDCPNITLTQNVPTNPDIITGSGSLSLLDQADFELKMFANEEGHPLEDFERASRWISGTLIPDSEFYTLRATDANGINWEWDRVSPRRSGRMRRLVNATFEGLRHRSRCKGSTPFLTLFFFEKTHVPYNRYKVTDVTVSGETSRSFELAASDCDFGDLRIELRTHPQRGGFEALQFEFKSTDPLPAAIEYRALEALRYVTFRPISWTVSLKTQNGIREVIIATRRGAKAPAIAPPIQERPDYAADFWNLFYAYLTHVQRTGDSEHYSPLSAQLHPIIHSETRELSVVGLQISVAVEGVLNQEFSSLAAPPAAFLEALDWTKKLLRRVKCKSADIPPRAVGALDAMRRARPMDKLKLLRDRGVVTDSMIKSWQVLRNASAHATIDPKSFDTQQLWTHCATVGTMLHLLIFTAVRYSGRYMDCSTLGWPTKEFVSAADKSLPDTHI